MTILFLGITRTVLNPEMPLSLLFKLGSIIPFISASAGLASGTAINHWLNRSKKDKIMPDQLDQSNTKKKKRAIKESQSQEKKFKQKNQKQIDHRRNKYLKNSGKKQKFKQNS